MKLTTKQIKSRYLDKEFSVLCWEKEENNRMLTIVSHESLEDIILNELSGQDGFYYDVQPILNIAPYPVMKCTMTDATGRIAIAIGEAHPESLVNQISKQNPVIMAANRAMDRAVIRYLSLDGKCLSTEEIASPAEYVSACADYANMGDIDDYSEDSPFGVVKPEEETTTIQETAIPEESVAADVVVEPEESIQQEPQKDSKEELGSVIIKFGKYRNASPAKTVAQIWADDASWAESMLRMMTPEKCSEETKKQFIALKEYKELM